MVEEKEGSAKGGKWSWCKWEPKQGSSPRVRGGEPDTALCLLRGSFCPPPQTLESPIDQGAWRAIVHRVAKSRARLSMLDTPGEVKEEPALSSEILSSGPPTLVGAQSRGVVHPEGLTLATLAHLHSHASWGCGQLRQLHVFKTFFGQEIPHIFLRKLPSEDISQPRGEACFRKHCSSAGCWMMEDLAGLGKGAGP